MPSYKAEHSPPFQYSLKPHRIAILAVLVMVFHAGVPHKSSARFQLHVHRTILQELVEVAEPKSYMKLIEDLTETTDPVNDDYKRLGQAMKGLAVRLKTPDLFNGFFAEVPCLYEDSIPFDRRSIFGYFCRDLYAQYSKLSYEGTIKVLQNFLMWCQGNRTAGQENIVRDTIRNDQFIYRPNYDRDALADSQPYTQFQKACVSGDPHMAEERLRKFFEQKFNHEYDSEIRQHGLLNLAILRYSMGHYNEAQKILQEAINVARMEDDNVVVQRCTSLLRRLWPENGLSMEPMNRPQPDISAMEILFDVKKLMDDSRPIGELFDKITEARAVYDLEDRRTKLLRDPNEQWAFHAVQAVVWRYAGCVQLASLHEGIVLAFTESGGSDDTRLKCQINQAQQWANNGQNERALKSLVDPETWRGLSVGHGQYLTWATEIWSALAIIMSRRGQRIQYEHWLLPRLPVLPTPNSHQAFFFTSPEYQKRSDLFLSTESEVGPLLLNSLVQRHFGSSSQSLDKILEAVYKAELTGQFRHYRLAMVLIADVGLEFGMTVGCKKLIDEIIPQVICGDDIELRAFACFVQARCVIASSDHSQDGLRDASRYLSQSEQDYKSLAMLQPLLDVYYYQSIVYHNLGMEAERDHAASLHAICEEEHKKVAATPWDKRCQEVWDMVSDVGGALTYQR